MNYDNRTEFDFWIARGLKKKNKYVILFFKKLFGFFKKILIYFSLCRKKLYSDADDLISPGLKLGVDVISSKTWFHTLNYCGCCLSSSVSFYIVCFFSLYVVCDFIVVF